MALRFLILTMAVHLALSAGSVGADADADVDRQARQLFGSLMSPYCPGSLLAECPSSQAAVLRDSVRARLQRGQSPEQIRSALVAVYGNEILASPPFEGLGTLTWIGVVAIFLGGLLVAALWMRRRPAPATGQARTASPGELERLHRELADQD